jgi:hypothetical protein
MGILDGYPTDYPLLPPEQQFLIEPVHGLAALSEERLRVW